MKLQQLFSALEDYKQSLPPLEIERVCHDTRQVIPGSVFVAIRGEKRDGHDFLNEAIHQGAFVLVVEDRKKVPTGFQGTVVECKDSRQVLDSLASAFYYNPGRELFCVGVTGTNGKTSITYFVEAILNRASKSAGVIGTVNHRYRNQIWPTEMTTPDPLFLHQRLREFCDLGAKSAVMEVSSHALSQKRSDSVPFDCVVFTNLTRDHLDYHKTMQNYFSAKQRLFTDLMWTTNKSPCWAIVNSDDVYGRRLRIAETAGLWTYGQKDSDFRFQDEEFDFTTTKYLAVTPFGEMLIEINMGGLHNIYNSLAAIAVGCAAGIPLQEMAQALKTFAGVPGRLQSVSNPRSLPVFVDYAHTPDALENTLYALRDIRTYKKVSNGKIWCVFGCGGDRDPGKRPIMGKIAATLADQVIITSDNPRTEDPVKIIHQIIKDLPTPMSENIKLEPDRKKAIEMALTLASSEDVVLIAGKGHEDYQIIGTQKIHFSDEEVIQKFFA